MNIKTIYRTAFILTMVFSVLSAVLLTVAFTSHFEAEIQHFFSHDILITFLVISFVITFAVPVIASILTRITSGNNLYPDESRKAHLTAFRLLSGLLFTSCFIFTLTGKTNLDLSSVLGKFNFFFMAMTALSMFAPIFSNKQNAITATLSIFPIIWGITSMLINYFDKTSPLNSPLKAFKIFIFMCLILAYVADARKAFGKQKLPAFVLLSLIGAASVSVVVPFLIISLSKNNISGISPIEAFTLTGASLFALANAVNFFIKPAAFDTPPAEEAEEPEDEDEENTDEE